MIFKDFSNFWKYIYIFILKNEKKKKNLVQKFGNGYCTICIARNETVLQYSLLVWTVLQGIGQKNCIAIGRFVLQAGG